MSLLQGTFSSLSGPMVSSCSSHVLPPLAGGGLLHCRVRVKTPLSPQLVEQVPLIHGP